MKPPDSPITDLPRDEILSRIRSKVIEIYGPNISARLIEHLEEEARFEHAVRKLYELFGPEKENDQD
jgi:hypothetical protein